MNENSRHISHLEAARTSIQDERTGIEVVGRSLTETEQQRLRTLAKVDLSIAAAITHLSNSMSPDTPTSHLLSDGMYQLANIVLAATLRIDLEQFGIISGDIFAPAGDSREYLLSFRSSPGFTVENSSPEIPLIAEDIDGRTSLGWLIFVTGDGQGATVDISFDDPVRGFTPNYAEQLSGRRQSQAMRTLGIEIEHEIGTVANPQWVHNGRTLDIMTAYQDAGFDTRMVGLANEIPQAPERGWDSSQLHGLMSDYSQASLSQNDWTLHLLMLSRASEPGLLGIMFDAGSYDSNLLPRQGAAVFQSPMQSLGELWLRKLLQTSVHELGHALNLAHPFEREIGRADSTSFMNYDWKYLGGGNTQRYWQDFQFTFNREELVFMRHGRLPALIPGGEGFHTVPYWIQGDGGYVPYVADRPTDDFSLELTTPDNDGLFDFGQPVLLTVSFHNHLQGRFNLPEFFLDPKAGFLSFVINRTEGGGSPDAAADKRFQPIVMRCFDFEPRSAETIPSGGSMSNNVNLTYGSAGFTFAEPGEYTVEARLELWFQDNSYCTLRSIPLRIRIAYPRSSEEERSGMRLFSDDIGCYFALGGSDILSQAESALLEIEERLQGKAKSVKHGLVANIRRSRAINTAREFIRYEDGHYQHRGGNMELSQSLLQSIDTRMNRYFDPATTRSTRAMATALAQQKEK